MQLLLSCKIFTQKEIRLSPSGRATNWKSIFFNWVVAWVTSSALFISKEKKKKKQITQFSSLIGRNYYFLKGRVNNKVLSRILNAETIMVVMNDQVKTVWGNTLKNQNWTKQSTKFSDWICRILGLKTVVGFGVFSVSFFMIIIFGLGCFLKAGGNPPSPHSQDKYCENILTPWCRGVLCECPHCALLQCKSFLLVQVLTLWLPPFYQQWYSSKNYGMWETACVQNTNANNFSNHSNLFLNSKCKQGETM